MTDYSSPPSLSLLFLPIAEAQYMEGEKCMKLPERISVFDDFLALDSFTILSMIQHNHKGSTDNMDMHLNNATRVAKVNKNLTATINQQRNKAKTLNQEGNGR